MNYDELLANWEFYSTPPAPEPEDAIFTSTQSNVSSPQMENYSELAKILNFHFTPQQEQEQEQEQAPPSIPIPVTDDRESRNSKRKRFEDLCGNRNAFHKQERNGGTSNESSRSPKLTSSRIRITCERRRRSRITDRMKALQELLPQCSNNLGAVSVLDNSIQYIKTLQHQLQSMCFSKNLLRYVLHGPVRGPQVPQSSAYSPMEPGNVTTSNVTMSADVPAVQGVPCNWTFLPPVLHSSSYYIPHYQVQTPMFNPFQQTPAAPSAYMQPISFPMFTTTSLDSPTQGVMP